jgi:hypothetical protein
METGTTEFFHAMIRKENQVPCPIESCPYTHWNKYYMKKHLAQHPIVRLYYEFQRTVKRDYEGLCNASFQLGDEIKALDRQIAAIDVKIARLEAREREIKDAAGVTDAISSPSTSCDDVQRAERRDDELLTLARQATDEARVERHNFKVALITKLFQLGQVEQRIERMEKSKDTGTSIALMARQDDENQ